MRQKFTEAASRGVELCLLPHRKRPSRQARTPGPDGTDAAVLLRGPAYLSQTSRLFGAKLSWQGCTGFAMLSLRGSLERTPQHSRVSFLGAGGVRTLPLAWTSRAAHVERGTCHLSTTWRNSCVRYYVIQLHSETLQKSCSVG